MMAVKSRRRAKNVFDSSSSSFSRSSHCSKVAVALCCAGVLFNSKNGAVLRLVSAVPPGGGGPGSGGSGGGSASCVNPTIVLTSGPVAADLRNDNGCSTKAGVEDYYGKSYTHENTGNVVANNSHIYNSFEAGFSSSQDNVISGWGCSTPSDLYDTAGGLDIGIAESKVRKLCYASGRYSFPNINATNEFVGILGPCGGHTDYHFHGRYHCLYSQSGAHSTSVGDVGPYKMYGKWEDYTNAKLPLLDACGAHFGTNPDSPSTAVYHYHAQDRGPYGVGCYGPNLDQSLVTVAQCRALYPTTCDDNQAETFTDYPQPDGTKKTFAYDRDCPCFDANGLNTGTITERPAIAQYALSPPVISYDNSTWTCGDGVSCMQTVEETILFATATASNSPPPTPPPSPPPSSPPSPPPTTTGSSSSSAGFRTLSTLAATLLASYGFAF